MGTIERVSTGLDGLDKMLGGGFPSQTAILLSGDAGSGKTLLGLNWLATGAAKGERCCYVSVCETEDELLRACDSIESLRAARTYYNKNLIFKHMAVGERMSLLEFVNLLAEYPQIDRLVVDNVNRLLLFSENTREYRTALAQLVRSVKAKARCTLFLCETSGDVVDTGNGESFECDGVVSLAFSEFEERPMRTLRVCKMRYTDFEPLVRRQLEITPKGIRLTSTKII